MCKIMKNIKNFAENTKGSVAVEVAIVLPLLLWALAAMAIFFDVFRTKSIAEKASFTISDALSRETNAITPDFVTNTRLLFDEMVGVQTPDEVADGGESLIPEEVLAQASSMRISVITWNEDEAEYELEWSKVRGEEYVEYQQADMTNIASALPNMADQDTVIVVETHMTYSTSLNVGLGDRDIETFVFTRPRYAPQLVFDAS